jgi:phospholipid/cholesterol/gamma-HCH transport system substrate-binding protein
VKPVWNRALAVGVLAAVTGAGFIFALTFFRKGGYSEKDSYLVNAKFSDATGLTWRSRVQIAGIQIGEVVDIELVGAKARLDIRVKKGIQLHTDACLTKTFPSALLPDALLEVQPGSNTKPLLESLPEEQREITCVREATSVQQLMDSLAKIASDVSLVTGDLADTVRGDKGLKEIVENLASATQRIDRTLAENQDNITALVVNVRDFTGDLREISRRDKDKIGRIATNVEQLTAKLNVIAASLQEIIDPGSGGRGGGGRGSGAPGGAGGAALVSPEVRGAIAQATPEDRAAASAEAQGLKQAVAKLTSSLDKLDQIMAKVGEGKSVAGRLLVDERLGRKVGTAAEEYADYVDRIFKLQIQLQLRSEWLLNQTLQNNGRPGTKLYFGARLLPRPDKFYLVEVVSDPRGVNTTTTTSENTTDPTKPSSVTTTKTVNEDKLTFSVQMGKRYGPVTFRIGIIEGSGGAGADLHVFNDRLQLSTSMYQFQRAFQSDVTSATKPLYPRTKVWLNYYFLDNFFITTGVDDFLNRWQQGSYPGNRKFNIGTDAFFGGGIYFTDDDLKTLLGAGAGSAASSAR